MRWVDRYGDRDITLFEAEAIEGLARENGASCSAFAQVGGFAAE